jgi:16S rRNA (guanine966-N2)-methyltransferase
LPVALVDGLRPTPERIRETLFNWLAPVIEGARCLDLFAGTGALGFEALSRGARAADLVENAAAAATVLRDISEQLGAACTVHQLDAFEFLRRSPVPQAFDIVFLDPPFADARYEELCRLIHERGWLAPGALVYIEQDRREDLPDLPRGWQVKKQKTAGNVRYSLIETVTERSSR